MTLYAETISSRSRYSHYAGERDAKTRSMMNLAMLGAMGRIHEWELHCKGALNNGVSKEEIRAIIHCVGIYGGVPLSLECFRAAKRVFVEQKME